MKHEELLAKIDKPLNKVFANHQEVKDLQSALRAVVKLHKPWEGTRLNPDAIPNGPWCTHCEEVFDGSIKWPCPTIQAIQEQLK